jgi:hypothetical protein
MTRKLTLDPESLSVDSFESDNADEARGTVQAHDEKAPCVISGAQPFSCPNSWDCYKGPLPGEL